MRRILLVLAVVAMMAVMMVAMAMPAFAAPPSDVCDRVGEHAPISHIFNRNPCFQA